RAVRRAAARLHDSNHLSGGHLLYRDHLSIAPGVAPGSRAGITVRVMFLVAAERLNKYYQVGAQRIHVLRDLELAVEKGEMLAIVGASGVGKSTLLHALGGLDRIDAGSIRIQDHEIASMSDASLGEFRNRNVGFVFQFHHLLPEFD